MQHLNTSSSNFTIFNTKDIAPSVVLGLCSLVGVPGNIVVIMLIVSNYKRENFTLKLMLNLAFSDILSLLTLPVWIYTWLYGWTLGLGLCKFVSYVVYCGLYSSLLTVTLMSVQRYLTVLYHQYWARLHGTGERVLLVTLWGLAGVLASPAIVLRNVDSSEMRCQSCFRSEAEEVATLFMETLLGFVVPFSILVTSYFCLHKKVNQTAFFRSQRMTKLVTSIVVTFFIFWIPIHVTNILGIFAVSLKLKTLKNISDAAWRIAVALTFINSCLNPFLYAFASRTLNVQHVQQDVQQSGNMADVSTRNV
ncbi:hypothetical protein AAFF_G00420910 [Aldrovandia affinis]|uniref:G-protein coupled receptors family 1 profile domain-containing protein n=1 Tax=Aldrovandia affinis TaxID=143900 RepID=A0AAD7WIZ0_9TELE|nr:hypothetical protein AAFF_G00420910 [Aldrovandia affinis]